MAGIVGHKRWLYMSLNSENLFLEGVLGAGSIMKS